MPTWLIVLMSGGVAVSALTWLFLYARRVGSVNTRLNHLEERNDNPQVLPQCNDIFTEIKENLANITGKVEAILSIAENGKPKTRGKKKDGR